MKISNIIVVLAIISVIGCTQKVQPQTPAVSPAGNTPTFAPSLHKLALGNHTFAIPSDWTELEKIVDSASYEGKDKQFGASLSYSKLGNDDFVSFVENQMTEINDTLVIKRMPISFAKNFDLNKYSGRDWYIGCYSVGGGTGLVEQCIGMTLCGNEAASVLFSGKEGALAKDSSLFSNILTGYKCAA